MTMASQIASPRAEAQRFGEAALGPIFADFCMRLWLHQRFLSQRNDATLLFCARGGLRLRLLYQRFLERTELPALLPSADVMISRVVAARTTVAHPGEALLAELGREFEGRPMLEVASALAQRDFDLPPDWQRPFEARLFTRLLAARDAGTLALRQQIAAQDELFREHLEDLTQGRRQIVLCDTGLYGSTVRLLRDGIPQKRWLCLQFARSNYKQLPTPHFDCTRGLVVESDIYKPWRIETASLRFWQLIEAALEPALPSVTSFVRPLAGAAPVSNLEGEGWRSRVEDPGQGLFAGALAHFDRLDANSPMRIAADARKAWLLFRKTVIWPDQAALDALDLGNRSRDFGRSEQVSQFAGEDGGAGPLARVRRSLWREGAIMRVFPSVGRCGLLALEAAHSVRAIRDTLRPRRSPARTLPPDPVPDADARPVP